jgi:hypothetical protein
MALALLAVPLIRGAISVVNVLKQGDPGLHKRL